MGAVLASLDLAMNTDPSPTFRTGATQVMSMPLRWGTQIVLTGRCGCAQTEHLHHLPRPNCDVNVSRNVSWSVTCVALLELAFPCLIRNRGANCAWLIAGAHRTTSGGNGGCCCQASRVVSCAVASTYFWLCVRRHLIGRHIVRSVSPCLSAVVDAFKSAIHAKIDRHNLRIESHRILHKIGSAQKS